jgi:hypothetical protein
MGPSDSGQGRISVPFGSRFAATTDIVDPVSISAL